MTDEVPGLGRYIDALSTAVELREVTTRRRRGRVSTLRRAFAATIVVALVSVGVAFLAHQTAGPGKGKSTTGSSVRPAPAASVTPLSVAPSPRFGASATFDAATRTVVLFGGDGPYGSLNDTWTWDGNGWHQDHPQTVPPARASAIMAYDPVSKEVLMASGMAEVPLSDPCRRTPGQPPVCTPPSMMRTIPLAGDLWAWDGHDWHRRLPDAQQPLPLAMTTDDRNGNVVLLQRSDPALATFTWSGARWLYHRPSSTPVDGNEIGVAYDPDVDGVLAIQTYQPGICMPDSGCTQPARTIATTWNGNAWQPFDMLGAPSSRPDLLDPTTLTADPTGGMLALDAKGNTWRLTDHRWARVATADHSPQHLAMAMASDPVHHQVMAFGGNPPFTKIPTSFPGTNDTWIWNGTTWQRFTAPAPAPIPPPAPALQTCVLNGPALVPNDPRHDGRAIRLTFSDLFGVVPCHLTVSVELVLVDSTGKPLAITGNPATATYNADVTGSITSVLEGGMTWADACAPDKGVQLEIHETGAGALPQPLTVALNAPTCAHPTTSTLTADPLTISAPATS